MNSAIPISSKIIRKIIIEQSKRANVGHIGSALSIVDILVTLYSNIMQVEPFDSPEHDRFILSNGHAVLALYAILFAKGIITEHELNSYCTDDSYLGVHPEFGVKGIEISTGSLGQGLSIGAGCALAAKLNQSKQRVFVLLSDAECNEGSVWETIMFAAHHRLSNLIAIIDLNGQQALGYTRDVMDLSSMAEKWKAFRWDVHEVDGNNIAQMGEILGHLSTTEGQPHVLIANTLFGKGISFMEKQIQWHYLPLSDEEYSQAMAEIGTGHDLIAETS
jgi:transketolase